MLTTIVLATFIGVAVLVVVAVLVLFRQEDRTRELLEEAQATGMNQVASLHPVIDPEVCITSGACIDACPEDVLGMVDGKTYLVQANDCIGHGRCQASCPVDAITLVFGTATRGVDIPLLRAGYETNVNGIFVVGELGGMGLIRNAMRQGTQVIEALRQILAEPVEDQGEQVDVLIVGAGPAGIAAALKATEQKLSYRLIEQYQLGGSVMHYPRRKLVFTEVIQLPIVGKFGKSEMLKEELVAEFERVTTTAGVEVLEQRRVVSVSGHMGSFVVKVDGPEGQELHRARTIVLAIGRRGTPQKLGCPGEDLPHVVYRLAEAEQFRRKKVLVVGGGDSAVEAAIQISEVAGAEVHLCYRGESFFRVKKKNRDKLEERVAADKITLHLQATVKEIRPGEVDLVTKTEGAYSLEIDDVIVNVGGVLPTPFLESMGIQVETKHGEAATVERDSARLAKTLARATNRISTRLSKTWAGDSARLAKGERAGDSSRHTRKARAPGTGRSTGRSSGRKARAPGTPASLPEPVPAGLGDSAGNPLDESELEISGSGLDISESSLDMPAVVSPPPVIQLDITPHEQSPPAARPPTGRQARPGSAREGAQPQGGGGTGRHARPGTGRHARRLGPVPPPDSEA